MKNGNLVQKTEFVIVYKIQVAVISGIIKQKYCQNAEYGIYFSQTKETEVHIGSSSDGKRIKNTSTVFKTSQHYVTPTSL